MKRTVIWGMSPGVGGGTTVAVAVGVGVAC